MFTAAVQDKYETRQVVAIWSSSGESSGARVAGWWRRLKERKRGVLDLSTASYAVAGVRERDSERKRSSREGRAVRSKRVEEVSRPSLVGLGV